MKTKPLAIVLILFTTLFTSSAQVLYKFGVNTLTTNLIGILSNHYLILGTLLYAVAGILAILSFRNGEVSTLYPIFATSYIWVSLFSIYFFGETINAFKWIGLITIIIGITFIGFGSTKLL